MRLARARDLNAAVNIIPWVSTTIIITSSNRWQILAGRCVHYIYAGFELGCIPVYQVSGALDAFPSLTSARPSSSRGKSEGSPWGRTKCRTASATSS